MAASTISVYKASAGSGKTYRLAYEYVRLLFLNRHEPHPHRSTLAVTFTNKATDEMKRRIVRELNALAYDDAAPFAAPLSEDTGLNISEIRTFARRFLTDILHDYSAFNISTIDGFFQQIVRSFARELGLFDNYGVELEQKNVLQAAADNMLFELDKPERKLLLHWLQQFADDNIENDNSWDIRHKIGKLGLEIFKESFAQHAQVLNQKLQDKDFLNNYKRQLRGVIDTFERTMQAVCDQAADIMARHNLQPNDFRGGQKSFANYFTFDKLRKGAPKMPNFVCSEEAREAVDDCSRWYAKQSPRRADIEAAYADGLNDCLKKIANCDLSAYHTAKSILANLNILGVLTDIDEQIRRYCSENNTVLISSTTDFLHKIIAGCNTPFIYEKTGINLKHFMIDEFQDTSRMQWENFKPLIDNSLAANNQNLIVGDVKQSIYRWRNSDWRLLYNGVDRDFPQRVTTFALDTNWRSAKRIVEFNNTFFPFASRTIAGDDDGNVLNHVYAEAHQKPHRTTEGHVRIEFLGDETEKTWREQALERLPDIINQLKARNYQLRHMTVLVRKNKEATEVANFLLEKGFEVVSNEALLICNAKCIKLLVALLKFFVAPDDRLNRAVIASLLGHEQWTDLAIPADDWLSQLVDLENVEELLELKHKPLFQMVEGLISVFHLVSEKNGVFLQAFQDEIFNYTSNHPSDINSFLAYWDEVSDSRFLAASDTQDAIRIMTVHKSKGLEFKAVIIPFCEWPLVESRSTDILWCALPAGEEPFAQLPMVPVNFSSTLAYTQFAKQYAEELLYRQIDTLNTAYVAFTRAEEEMIILAPRAEGKKEKNTIATLLSHCFAHNDEEMVEFGACEPLQTTAETDEIVALPLTYDTESAMSGLHLRRKADDVTAEQRYGLLMHAILSRMATANDLSAALRQSVLEGEVRETQCEEIGAQLRRLLAVPQVADWFSGKYRVLNEVSIITPNGGDYRPDRVMIDGNRVIVVDYKFGQRKSAYKAQVSNYMRLIESMGYAVEGYIWYTLLGEIEQVHLA